MTEGPLVLTRAISVQRALAEADIESAIGGALALAYHVDEPRATQDIDLNVALPASQAIAALRALPADVPWDRRTLDHIERDDQVRILWPVPGEVALPLDLFFAVDDLHRVVQSRSQLVPMLDSVVRIVSSTDLTIFKALFNRSKDWPDIQSMIEAHDSTVDVSEAIRVVAKLVGEDDQRAAHLREFLTT